MLRVATVLWAATVLRVVAVWEDTAMDFSETLLPGVGVRYDGTTHDGVPLSLLIGRHGETELCAYQREDPDAVSYHLRLNQEEATALAELLGAPRVSTRLADLTREVPGLSSGRFEIQPGSRYQGHPLGDSKARTRSGCSVVALVRGDEVTTAPGPDTELQAGDVVVAIGSEEGLEHLGAILARSPEDGLPPPPGTTNAG